MSEMIERVAQRIESVPEYGIRKNKANPPETRYEVFHFTDEGDVVILSAHPRGDIADSERYSLQREANARAAIEAMREPTDEMRSAVENDAYIQGGLDDCNKHDIPDEVWRIMIDAALGKR